MERRTVAGIETAFSMILTAIALVAGLLIAEVVAPSRRMRLASRSMTDTADWAR